MTGRSGSFGGAPLGGALALLMAALLTASAVATRMPEPDPQGAATERALLTQYCVTCHNQRARIGGLALDVENVANLAERPEIWEKVVRKLRAGLMPPAGQPRPAPAAAESLAAYLETSLDQMAAAHPNPGRPDSFRRLNRTEYKNALRDLLALDVDTTALLPRDDLTLGFDNISVSGLSPTLLERYLAAAKEISRLAMGAPVGTPVTVTVTVPQDLTQDYHLEGLPFGTRGGTLIRHTFPRDGEYQFEVRLGRNRSGAAIAGLTEPHDLEITIDGARARLFTILPDKKIAAYGEGVNVEKQADAGLHIRVPIKAGPRDIGVAFLEKSAALLETERQPWMRRHAADYADQRSQPVVWTVDISGPFDAGAPGDTPSRARILSCHPAARAAEAACARTILAGMARRAYRRAVTDQDVSDLLRFYQDARAQGDFDAGIEAALRALLVSPQFLFRIERDPPTAASGSAYRLSDVELASRLSFFLWSSIPDDDLLATALRGELSKPAVLERQVKRMLADSKSDALVNNFSGQWLYLRNLPQIVPDPRLYPDFDELLRQAFRRETELFFGSVLREERSVNDLLTADYTFMNERLARHYGVPNVYGDNFRRVRVTDENRRGLLGHGSVLTVTSYATRTSPVVRGKWILENILGSPPPEPPPNVPPLPDSSKDGATVLTMRERMAKHRSNPVCATCHSMIDPAGFALEHFDAIGKYRVRDEGFNPIDGSGTLPDGTKFDSVVGLRQALLGRPGRFVTTVTEKMLTYAVARGVTPADMPAVRRIVHDAATDDYKLSSIVLGIVKSVPFQMRRSSS